MKNRQIVFTEPNTARLLEVGMPTPAANEVVVETAFSSISCGTERANLTGDPSVSIASSETDPVVFPRYTGYSSAGTVIAKGCDVRTVEIGDKVALAGSFHKKYNLLPESNVLKIDSSRVSLQDAALFYIGIFPLAAVRKTHLEIGESMLVMGLGILGLMSVQFSKSAGAVPVIAADPVAERREKALQFGADYALDPTAPDFAEKVKALTGGGTQTAIEVTGLGVGLNQCLDCMAKRGRIALLGCTRDKNFTVDYYRKIHGPGIQLFGAHTLVRPAAESSPGYFTQRDDMFTLLKLCALGRIHLAEMVDAVYSPEDCAQIYNRLAFDRDFPAVNQFDWRNLE